MVTWDKISDDFCCCNNLVFDSPALNVKLELQNIYHNPHSTSINYPLNVFPHHSQYYTLC